MPQDRHYLMAKIMHKEMVNNLKGDTGDNRSNLSMMVLILLWIQLDSKSDNPPTIVIGPNIIIYHQPWHKTILLGLRFF